MKQKLFIALFTTGIVVAVVGAAAIITAVRQTPAVALTQEELADVAIGQFGDRPNGGAGEERFASNFIESILYPERERYEPGCFLRFSLLPEKKAVDPGENISYILRLSNAGDETCRNVSLSMYYTEKEQFVSSSPSPTASDYYWSGGDIESGDAFTVSLITKNTAQVGEQLLSEGCATGDNTSDICAQTVIFIERGASGSLTLSERIASINIPNILSVIWGQLFSKKELGIWVWDSVMTMTPAYAREVITTSKRNGFNAMYLTIDDYVQISELKDENERAKQTENYMNALSTFIQAANRSGLQVDAVGGARDWAKEDNRWKGYALIEFVKTYNETHPKAKIRNFQYDVEPYLLSEYDANKQTVLKEFVHFINESTIRMKDVPAGFTIVIPHFYDSVQRWTPSFEYNNEEGYAFTHLLRILSQKSDTSIIIMSYRNFFEGSNGAKEISEPEIREASEGNFPTKIIIAQETGDVSPAYVTFRDYPKSSLFDALNDIQSYFKRYSNFGGVAVHYFDAFLKLSAQDQAPVVRTTIIERLRTVLPPQQKPAVATTTQATVSTTTENPPSESNGKNKRRGRN